MDIDPPASSKGKMVRPEPGTERKPRFEVKKVSKHCAATEITKLISSVECSGSLGMGYVQLPSNDSFPHGSATSRS
jgi:hypothetical protein